MRVSAVSGALFAGLSILGMVLVRQAPGLASPDQHYTDFYTAGSGNVLVTVGLHIVPFAGIAFLWHMSATRALLEALPGPPSAVPRFLQLLSGVLSVGLLFAGTASVAAIALLTVFSAGPLPQPDVARALTAAGYGMVFVFGVRAAGMYMLTTTTLSRRASLLPRPVAAVSYLGATFLLLSTTFHPAVLLVFPAWVLLFCGVLLLGASRDRSARTAARAPSASPAQPDPPSPNQPLVETEEQP